MCAAAHAGRCFVPDRPASREATLARALLVCARCVGFFTAPSSATPSLAHNSPAPGKKPSQICTTQHDKFDTGDQGDVQGEDQEAHEDETLHQVRQRQPHHAHPVSLGTMARALTSLPFPPQGRGSAGGCGQCAATRSPAEVRSTIPSTTPKRPHLLGGGSVQ